MHWNEAEKRRTKKGRNHSDWKKSYHRVISWQRSIVRSVIIYRRGDCICSNPTEQQISFSAVSFLFVFVQIKCLTKKICFIIIKSIAISYDVYCLIKIRSRNKEMHFLRWISVRSNENGFSTLCFQKQCNARDWHFFNGPKTSHLHTHTHTAIYSKVLRQTAFTIATRCLHSLESDFVCRFREL